MRAIAVIPTLALAILAVAALTPSGATETASPPAHTAEAPDFWGHWGDGKAEVIGYQLEYPRYGEIRQGTAVTIFVNEDFADSVGVKHEDPSRDRSRVYPAMKLNWIQDFPTGVYDYSLMTSVFSSLAEHRGRPAGSIGKVSFSSQEWCGHVYAQLLFNGVSADLTSHSYFDGEADQKRSFSNQKEGLPEDAVLLWARGLAGPKLAPGESREIPILRSLERSRLIHVDVDWQEGTAARGGSSSTIQVPAGEFTVDRYTLTLPAAKAKKLYPVGRGAVTLPARTWTIEVETEFPHRVVRWSRDDGLKAEMIGKTRMPYWGMNRNGYEAALEEIGLKRRPPRTP